MKWLHVYTTTCIPESQALLITQFVFAASWFRVTGYFETTTPNEPHMALNTKRPKVPHIHITTTSESEVHRITQNDIEKYKVAGTYYICATSILTLWVITSDYVSRDYVSRNQT